MDDMVSEPTHKHKILTIVFVTLTLAMLCSYIIVLFEMSKNKSFVFSENTPEKPDDAFYPLGKITPLTEEEKEHRRRILGPLVSK